MATPFDNLSMLAPEIIESMNDRVLGEFELSDETPVVDDITHSKLFSSSNAQAPIADYVHANRLGNNATNLFPGPITNPDVPRNVTATFETGWTAGNITVVGTDQFDDVVTEVIVAVAGSTVNGVKIFKTVTSITKGSVGAAKTVSIGIGTKLGIVGNVVGTFGILTAGDIVEAVDIDATYNAFTPTTEPDAATTYVVMVNVQVTPTQDSHTHTVTVSV